MGLLLAPYNNAMRLGQGFNSYTQEICIDDAVITDPGRPLNTLTNDGTTMADLRISMQGPSAYRSIRDSLTETEVDKIPITGHKDDDEVAKPKPIEDTKPTEESGEDDTPAPEHAPKAPLEKSGPLKEKTKEKPEEEEDDNEGEEDAEDEEDKTGDSDGKDDAEETDEEDSEEDDKSENTTKPTPPTPPKKLTAKQRRKAREAQKAKDKAEEEEREGKRKAKEAEDEKQRAIARKKAQEEEEARRKAADERARDAAGLEAYTRAERDAWLKKAEIQQSKEAAAAKGEKTHHYVYKPSGARGPAQIVTYSSRFVEKLSDITDDMNISGALSIKYGAIGGSGRGAFVNSDKFHDSDLNFYISVKVINQTTNMKDALVYQPLRSVDGSNFREVYGDSFISGFLEGGEFNAIVSMKVLNKLQMTKIKAEAKVALTVGIAEVKAEAAVDIAKKNINNNTETTIQVSWSGGGYIKPIDEPWTIESLMGAAARFPDLVAVTPQRTYSILTKYESLRSFVKLKPAAYSTMQYECAQLYTNMLMDTFMDYKAVLKKLSADIFDIEHGISVLKENPRSAKSSRVVTKQALDRKGDADDDTPFEVSLSGLDRARRAARFQMVRIVNEVDEITKDAKKATDEDRLEPFQTPRVFKDRLPLVKPVVSAPANPLSNEKILPGPDRRYGALCPELEQLEDEERLAITELIRERPDIARYFRLTKPVGSTTHGTPFNDVEFLKHSVTISSVKVGVTRGVITYLMVQYSNGLQCLHGASQEGTEYFTLENLGTNERIIAASIETGEEIGINDDGAPKPIPEKGDPMETESKPATRITRLKLYTNRGQGLLAQSKGIDESRLSKVDMRGTRKFKDLNLENFDPVMERSYIKGFWGCSQNGILGTEKDGLWRIGIIWGNDLKPEPQVVDEEVDANAPKKRRGTGKGKK